MSKPIELAALTPDQKKELFAQMKLEEQQQQEATANNRKAYKTLVNDVVPLVFNRLKIASDELQEAKTFCFQELKSLIEMKADVYGKTDSDEQYSHSFTTESGITLIVGNRIADGWDDTVTVGISKVNECLDKMIENEKTRMLIASIRRLMSKDAKGNLKASRVFELQKLGEESKDDKLMDAITIIRDAYRPSKSKQFVTARFKGPDGGTIDLPLTITDAVINEEVAEKVV